MTPAPDRDWQLVSASRVRTNSKRRCDDCKVRLKWAFTVRNGGFAIIVGPCCLPSLAPAYDAQRAIRTLDAKRWLPYRDYRRTTIAGVVWGIGRVKVGNGFWVGWHEKNKRFAFSQITAATFKDAQMMVAMLVADRSAA